MNAHTSVESSNNGSSSPLLGTTLGEGPQEGFQGESLPFVRSAPAGREGVSSAEDDHAAVSSEDGAAGKSSGGAATVVAPSEAEGVEDVPGFSMANLAETAFDAAGAADESRLLEAYYG